MICIDFETYSEANLKKVGAWAYSQHPSTDIICMSWSFEEGAEQLWEPGQPFPAALGDAIAEGVEVEVEAHNAQFEMAIWWNVGMKRYGFPPVPMEQWRCSMATAGYRALPQQLERLAKVLRLPVQKDMAGNAAMRKISQPTRKGERLTKETNPDEFAATASYCLDDNRVERLASKYCGKLPTRELAVWQADMRLQRRGLKIDVDLCEAAIETAKKYEQQLNAELREITGNAFDRATQRDKFLAWLRDDCLVDLPDFTADTIDIELKKKDLAPEILRALEIRRYLSRSSYKKYQRALECLCQDGRVRGATRYYGATTGRNTGQLFQPLNMRRPVFNDDSEALADAIKTRDIDFIELVGGANLMECLADAVRGIIISEEGHDLIAGDYSAIEAVVTAGLANETAKLDVFRRGEDPYCWYASQVTGRTVLDKKHPDVTEQDLKDRQNIGKPGELAYGFAGGVGAWRNFDDSDTFTDEQVDEFKKVWRSKHPRIVEMWNALDYCAKGAVLHPGETYSYTAPDRSDIAIRFQKRGDFLLCQIPSGRLLHYFKPSVRQTLMPWTDDNDEPVYRPTVHYWTSQEGQFKMVRGWRGQWTENVVQGEARDLMVQGWLNVEKAGYEPILTVYDEVLGEPPEDHGSIEEYEHLLLDFKAPYAEDWPIKCEAWRGKRYCKK